MDQGNHVQVKTDEDVEKQEAMAFLRERFLYLLSNLCVADTGHCKIMMYENTEVKCDIRAFDSNFENIIVENLHTPIPSPINKAILRTSDIISIQFGCDYTQVINKF